MVDQNDTPPPNAEPLANRTKGGGRRSMFVIALVAVALLAGVAGSLLPKAFGHGFAWRHFGMYHDTAFAAPLSPAQIDDRIDRLTRHIAIELDATADQQARIADIFKSAIADLRAMREKAAAARSQAIALLTAPTIDRAAIERLRVEQIALAEAASKRIAQAVADAADVLNPEQRRKAGDWLSHVGPWVRWFRG